MANLKTVKKFLWPKSRSRKILMIVCYCAIGYLVLGGLRIVPLIALNSSFVSCNTGSLNGYAAGSSQLNYAGQYNIPGSGQSWQGYTYCGNTRFINDTPGGQQQIGNVTTFLHTLLFQTDVVICTLTPWSSRVPGCVMATSTNWADMAKGLQIAGWATQFEHVSWGAGYVFDSAGFWYPRLVIPNNSYDLADHILTADVGVNVQLNPMLLGQGLAPYLTDTTGAGNWTLSNYWCGVLSTWADTTTAATTGFLSEPGTKFSSNNLTAPSGGGDTSTSTDVSAPKTGYNAPAESDVSKCIVASGVGHSNLVDYWSVLPTTSLAHYAGAITTVMSPGTPVTIVAGEPVNYNLPLLNDTTRCSVVAHVPFSLRPQTDIYQTEYKYNYYQVHDGMFAAPMYLSASHTGQTCWTYSGIACRDVVAISPMDIAVQVLYNYSWNPLTQTCGGGGCPPAAPPLVNGTDTGWDTGTLTSVESVGGNQGNWLPDWFYWILIIGGIAIAAWIAVKLIRRK